MMQKIYIIQRSSDGLLKIGISQNPSSRVRQLQCGSACELSLIYQSEEMSNARTIENNIHKSLAGRACGEWFSCSTEDALKTISEHIIFATREDEVKADNSLDKMHLFALVNTKSVASCGAGLGLTRSMNNENFFKSKDFVFNMLEIVIKGDAQNFLNFKDHVEYVLCRLESAQ